MLLCDLDLASEINPDQVPQRLRFELLQKHRWINYVLLFVGLYLGGAPLIHLAEKLWTEPGWALLSYLVPHTQSNARWFFNGFSAVCNPMSKPSRNQTRADVDVSLMQPLCVFAISRISWLKRIFETSVFQFLGQSANSNKRRKNGD